MSLRQIFFSKFFFITLLYFVWFSFDLFLHLIRDYFGFFENFLCATKFAVCNTKFMANSLLRRSLMKDLHIKIIIEILNFKFQILKIIPVSCKVLSKRKLFQNQNVLNKLFYCANIKLSIKLYE